MVDYKILEHTADAKFQAYGKTVDEAFANAVKGMTAIVTDPDKLKDDRTFPIEVTADTNKKLLFDFLDRIIFLMDMERFIAARADVTIEKDILKATVYGTDITEGNIKAVTYSEMLVEETEDGWMLQVVVDI